MGWHFTPQSKPLTGEIWQCTGLDHHAALNYPAKCRRGAAEVAQAAYAPDVMTYWYRPARLQKEYCRMSGGRKSSKLSWLDCQSLMSCLHFPMPELQSGLREAMNLGYASRATDLPIGGGKSVNACQRVAW